MAEHAEMQQLSLFNPSVHRLCHRDSTQHLGDRRHMALSGVIPSTDRFAILGRIHRPTQVVHGNKDVVVTSINESFLLAEHLPNAQLTMYRDASHGRTIPARGGRPGARKAVSRQIIISPTLALQSGSAASLSSPLSGNSGNPGAGVYAIEESLGKKGRMH